jgi:DNA-binding XRE family transcriptional regulator
MGMTKAEIKKVIDQYVDERYFYKDKLLKYLDMHQMVGNEIFEYCDKGLKQQNGRSYHSKWLESESGYAPLYKDSFVQRIPFYFYVAEWTPDSEQDHFGTLDYLFQEYYAPGHHQDSMEYIEDMYQDLIYLFYDRKISLYDIFDYCIDQTDVVGSGIFRHWVEYVRLCEKEGINNYTPERFITAYNELLEKVGQDPIIYKVRVDCYDGTYRRSGSKLTFEGSFPCDFEGNPIMKWIGLQTENVKSISCTVKKSEVGELVVEILPDTKIDALGVYDEEDSKDADWYNVFTGAKRMSFDYRCLKYFRKEAGYTQAEVADAIGANVRTYQKWENGTTTPDCQNMIRLMNWLDIRDVQDVITYD